MKSMVILVALLADVFISVESAQKCQRRICNLRLIRDRYYRRTLSFKIKPLYCTHVILHRAQVTDRQEINLTDDDGLHEIYQVFDIRKNSPQMKVILAVQNYKFDDFVKMYTSDEYRKKFIQNLISYVRRKTIDGVKIDVQPSEGGNKEKFTRLIKELAAAISAESAATKKPRLLLSVGIPSDKSFLDKYYDVLEISNNVDMLDLATYSFFELVLGMKVVNSQHHSPLYSKDKSNTKTIDFMCRYIAGKGVRKDKINVGLPFFHVHYLLENSQIGVYSLHKYSGYVPFCQVSFLYQKYYTLEPEKGRAVDFHKYQGYYTERIMYDDPDSIKEKVKYIKTNHYGGIVMHNIDDDDHVAMCKRGTNALSRAVYEECSAG